jgi:sulfite exporter TauE/SafE
MWTALIIGFAGSLHCLGMCSPLAMATTKLSPNIIMSRLLYNGGRIMMYGLLGSIVASVGFVFPLVKYQNLISIILGVALLVISLTGVTSLRVPVITKALGTFSLLLKKLFAKFLQHKGSASTFVLGCLNGVLPCGLSFLALTYCITFAGPMDGFNFMFWFGVGTLPVMLGFTTIFVFALKRFHIKMNYVTTGMMIASAVLLIARAFLVHADHSHRAGQAIDIVICR